MKFFLNDILTHLRIQYSIHERKRSIRLPVAPVIDRATVSRHTQANFGSGQLGALVNGSCCDVKIDDYHFIATT